MRKITETISKEIVAAAEGEIVGIVTNAYVDGKLSRVRGYKVSNDEWDAGRLLPIKRLIGDEDAMIVKNASLLTEPTCADCPLGAKIFDTLGVFHGALRDLLFEEGTGKVLSLVSDDGEIAPDRVLGFGKSAVLLRAPCHDGVLFRRKPSAARRALIEKVPVPAGAPAPTEGKESEAAPEPLPEPLLSGEYAFLLGRTVLKTIVAEGEVVTKEGEIVTPELLHAARAKGKLVELTVNSRK